uniref:Uncharacterized protein n=1 Tax=Manihot esculenta TaxID=3983 RepID=A0A2C9UD57_MANES
MLQRRIASTLEVSQIAMLLVLYAMNFFSWFIHLISIKGEQKRKEETAARLFYSTIMNLMAHIY